VSLDIFQDDQTNALADAANRIAPDLPATFGDTFDAAVTSGIEWHNSVASQFAKEHALGDYIQNVRDMTGETLPNPGYLVGGGSLDEFNAKQQALNEKYPINLSPLTANDIDQMTARRMAKVHGASVAMGGRERTWGGTFGGLAGGLTASVTDPVMLATLPLGGMGELGIVGRAAEFGAINAGTEGAIAAAQYRAHERAVPGSSAEIPGEILSAGVFGVVLGGAFGTLGKFLKAGEKPLPTSLRDAVNTGASDAQLDATNVFPTAEGEIAGRDAITQAVTQAAKGEPVTAGRDFDPAHVQAFADSVGAHDPEALAAAGDRALRPITSGEIPDVEHLATMPIAGEDTAGYWDRYLEGATPEERAAVGATDEAARPEPPSAETLASESPRPGNDVSGRITPTDLSPKDTAALAADPATYEAVQRNLDRIRLENPDAEFSTQVRQPDGSYQLVTRKLEDVLDEIDGMHETGKELMACATGMMAAE
jgi:hypothetical protein